MEPEAEKQNMSSFLGVFLSILLLERFSVPLLFLLGREVCGLRHRHSAEVQLQQVLADT